MLNSLENWSIWWNTTPKRIFESIMREDIGAVREMIKAGVNFNIFDNFGMTPLLWAANSGSYEMVKLLIEDGKANIELVNHYGHTPLIAAAEVCGNGSERRKDQYTKTIKLLLEKGCNKNARDKHGRTALLYAVRQEQHININVIKVLLEYQVNLEYSEVQCSLTPLCYAVASKNLEAINLLLAAGANRYYSKVLELVRDSNREIRAIFGIPTQEDEILHQEDELLPQENSFIKRLEEINYQDKVNEDFCCPISHEIMSDPITTSSGITYDRKSLADYFKAENFPDYIQCPVTRLHIPSSELSFKTNVFIKNQIEKFVSEKEKEATAIKNETPIKKGEEYFKFFTQQPNLKGENENPSNTITINPNKK